MTGFNEEEGLKGPRYVSRRMACPGSALAEEQAPPMARGASKSLEDAIEARQALSEALSSGVMPGPGASPDLVSAIGQTLAWIERYTSTGYDLYEGLGLDPATLLGPDTQGTVPVLLHKGTHAVVVDFVYGHKEVAARDNYRLLAYAAGAHGLAARLNVALTSVTMVVIQPRLYTGATTKTWTLMTHELTPIWASMKLQLNRGGEQGQECIPNDHCLYCRVSLSCAARMYALVESEEEIMTVAQNNAASREGNSVGSSTDAELAGLLIRLPVLESVISDIRKEATARIMAGGRVQGFKVVEGKATRKWLLDEEGMRKKFKGMKLTRADFEVVKIGSPSKIEKLSKLSEGQKKNLPGLWERSTGSPSLVTEVSSGTRVGVGAEELNKADGALADSEALTLAMAAQPAAPEPDPFDSLVPPEPTAPISFI